MKKYQTGGIKSYNPNLAKKDKAFQTWYMLNTLEGQGEIPYSDALDYDYYSFYRNKGVGNIQDHFPDTYKRPTHPTFSNESIYSTPDNPGGRWEGEKYIPMKKLKKAQMGDIVPPAQPNIPPANVPNLEEWYRQHPETAQYRPITPMPETERQFDPMQPNAWALGLMGAYAGSKMLLNKSREKNYEKYKSDWIRRYSIPSLIQDPNKFSSIQYEAPMARKGGMPLDKYQNAGTVKYDNNGKPYTWSGGPEPVEQPRGKATTADSLAVYNNTQELAAYYNNKDYQPVRTEGSADFKTPIKNNKEITNANALAYTYFYSNQARGSSGMAKTPESNKENFYTKVPRENYRKDINSNQYYQRETADFILDTRAPMTLFDKRIKPQYKSVYQNIKRGDSMEGDMVQLFQYDPIAVKPYAMLTPAEKKIRDTKYGTPKPTKVNGPRAKFPVNTNDLSLGTERPEAGIPQMPEMYDPKKPTSYSYTTQGEGYNEQNVAYLPDQKTWEWFTKNRKGLKSSQQGTGYGTATGYQKGGLTMRTPQQQGAGYFAYPNASSLTFPGKGERTFVPGPFPLAVKDDNGTQIMTNKPVKTKGRVVEIPIFEQGGEIRKHAIKVDREDATIEAEKGELILGAGAPGDIEDQEKRVGVGLYKIGGNTHARGGTPLLAHPGDFVFSNDTSLAVSEEQSKLLIGKEIKKLKLRTPAKLAAKYLDLNEFIDLAQNEKMDPITRKTAMLNINNFVDRLAEIAYVQEEKKNFPDGVPAFVQASLDTRFDAKGLQQEMDEFRYGGSVLPKHQTKGIVDESIRSRSRLVDQVPQGYDFYGARDKKKYYKNAQGQLVEAPAAIPGGTPGTPWEKKMIELLQSGVTIDQLSTPDPVTGQRHGTKEGLTKRFGQYYVPRQTEDFVYTPDNGEPSTWEWPNMDRQPMTAPNRPGIGFNPNITGAPGPAEDPLDQYLQGSNDKFNVNTAEAVNLLASAWTSDKRYPPAFRNEEIQNAKALIASGGRPISEQPFLNSNRRNLLGYDQGNNASGAAGATRGLAAYSATLGADNTAISNIYNQNILRGDQRAQQLAQLEIADGQDRIGNAERYDNKLEMLHNNIEKETRDKLKNVALNINAMQRDRDSKRLFNVMSDYYQINRDNSIGLKPTYKIENGKVVPYQRNVADLIRSSGQSTNQAYYDRLEKVFALMQRFGIRSSSSVDDLVREGANPNGIPR